MAPSLPPTVRAPSAPKPISPPSVKPTVVAVPPTAVAGPPIVNAGPPVVNAAPIQSLPTAVVADPVAVGASPTVAPITAPPGGAVPEAPKKKREFKREPTTPWWGVFAWSDPDPATGVQSILQDQVDGAMVDRRIKIDGAVPMAAFPNVEGDAGYNPQKNDALKPKDFKRAGDYWRYMAAAAQYNILKYTDKANAADAGRSSGTGTRGPSAAQKQLAALLEALSATLPPEAFAAVQAKAKATLSGVPTA